MRFNTFVVALAFAILCTSACTKKVSSNAANLGGVNVTSNVSCIFTPSFSTVGGNSVIAGYPTSASYAVDYSCSSAASAQCGIVSRVGSANSNTLSACENSGTITVPSSLSSGKYTVSVKGVAADNSITDAYTYRFAIDRDAPYVLGFGSVIMTSLTETSFSFSFQTTDPSSGDTPASGVKNTQCLLSQSSALPSAPVWSDCSNKTFSASNLNPATKYYVFFRVEDNAGNLSLETTNPGIDSIAIDTSGTIGPGTPGLPGICSISTQFPNGFQNSSPVKLEYSCPNNPPVNKCILYTPGQNRSVVEGQTESGFEDCGESKYEVPLAAEGDYQFCVADGAGGTVRCKTFTYDRTPPTVTIGTINSTSNTAVVNFSGSDLGSGIDRFTCALLNKNSGVVYKKNGAVVNSVDDALNDLSLPCGSTGVSETSVTFDASLIGPRTDYIVYVKAHNKAGLHSLHAEKTFLIAGTSSLGCVITDPRGNEWKNSSEQSYSFKCGSPDTSANIIFTCQVENTAGIATKPLACNVGAPQVYVVPASGILPSYTINLYEGTFSTAGLGSFATSGDQLRVRVTAQDRSSTGSVLATASVEDLFRVDTKPAAITHIGVNASSSEVQVSYTAEDIGAPTRGSGVFGVSYKLFEILGANSSLEITDFDVVVSGNDLRFQPRNLSPTKKYRVDLTATDKVGNSSTASSLEFPGPNPNPGPSCQLTLVDGFSVDSQHPSPSAITNAKVTCLNPFVENAGESNHSTRAMCRITRPDASGNPQMTDWKNCTETNATLVDNAPYNWRIENSNKKAGAVKLEVYGCDSTYTTRCGAVSDTTFYFGTVIDGAWGAQSTVYFGGDTQTKWGQKVCNNPVPSLGGSACVVESFVCVAAPCNSWAAGLNTAEGYQTEIRKLGECRTADYKFSRTDNRCVPDCAVNPNQNGCGCAAGKVFDVGTQACQTPVNGGWGPWVTPPVPGTCATCGGGFAQLTLTRSCDSPAPMFGGATCVGSPTDTLEIACNPTPCNQTPVDGGWASWSNWKNVGECSAACGGGYQEQKRTRSCTSPAPANGGDNCSGHKKQERNVVCNVKACPYWESKQISFSVYENSESITCSPGLRPTERKVSGTHEDCDISVEHATATVTCVAKSGSCYDQGHVQCKGRGNCSGTCNAKLKVYCE
jgi:hypothetical protein